MGWKDSLRKSSFKGAAFWWEDATTTLDPMIAVHKYPQRKGGWTEDLGHGPDEFQMTGYVIGADYMTARDALIKAIKEGGAGTLVHPTLGERTVMVKPPVQITESTREGGWARFTMTFVEAGENTYPTETAVTTSAAATATNTAKSAATADFVSRFSTSGLDLLQGDAGKALTSAGSTISSAFGASRVPVRTASGALSQLAGLTSVPEAAVADASGLASRLTSLFGGLAATDSTSTGSTSTTTTSQVAASAETANTLTALATVSQTTGTVDLAIISAQQDINRAALALLIRRLAAIAAAELVMALLFASRDEALAARDQAVALLDAARIDDGATGDVFAALTDLRAATVKVIGEQAGTLASLRTIEMGETLPAALVAYRQLGDAARAEEIVSRNRAKVWNPLFVPGGAALEVLDD